MKDYLGRFLLEWRINEVLPHVTGRLLDIGCGTNELARRHSGNGVGVDVYNWGDVDFVVKDTANLPFGDGEFDTVSIVAALNHIPNREEVLREAFRCLCPGGRIIVTMIPPALSRVWHALRSPWDADQKERGMKAGEVFGFSAGQVYSFLEVAGFKPIVTKRFMFGVNLLVVAVKAETQV